ncbi:protein of unknown function [Hyphomicrobium sp. MC1]|nr:protein of unknown function [Hyphomicrobium sp. MC1]
MLSIGPYQRSQTIAGTNADVRFLGSVLQNRRASIVWLGVVFNPPVLPLAPYRVGWVDT